MPISAAILGAFKALSVVKKTTWKAMRGAFNTVKGITTPLNALANVFRWLTPIFKVFSTLFKLLGVSIMKAAMPAIQMIIEKFTDPDFIQSITDLGTEIGELITTLITPELIDGFMNLIILIMGLVKVILTPGFFQAFGSIIKEIAKLIETLLTPDFIETLGKLAIGIAKLATIGLEAFKPLIEWISTVDTATIGRVIYGIGMAWAFLHGLLTGGFPWGIALGAAYATAWGVAASGLLSLQKGTPFVPTTGPYLLHRGEEVISVREKKREKKRGDIIINIDLRSAVVDNVDRLSRRIAEQVMIHIG